MATLATRVLSGKGLARIDIASDDFKKAKIISVYCDVVRQPSNKYLNLNYNPPRSRYATINFMRDEYVLRSEAMEFPSCRWDYYPDPSAQTMLAVDCAYAGVLQSFVNLETALGLTVISVINNIHDWKWQDLFFEELRVVCYGDCAVRVVIESTPYDLCPDQTDKTPNPPPPPPPPPPVVPPGTPLSSDTTPLSPAYDGDTDSGDSVPNPLDVPTVPPPEGTTCTAYTLHFTLIYTPLGGTHPADDITVTRAVAVYGEVSFDFRVNPSDASLLETQHRGNPFAGACGDYVYRTIASMGLGAVIRSWSGISIS